MKKSHMTRRQFVKAGLVGGAGLMLPWKFTLSKALADAQIPGLSDPAMRPKFTIGAPNALAPSFKYHPVGYRQGRFLYDVAARQIQHTTGLLDPYGNPVTTTVWGYAPPFRGAGLAGFYFIRDNKDTGKHFNPLGLPAYPYELAYAVQDRMFRDNGELFYSAFPGDPFYADFIETPLPEDLFPGGGPTALAEFFGDHILVNGVIWPKTDVEPRNYRMHLLNGTDSRFMVVRFRAAALGATDLAGASDPLPFHVIGSDQGLASEARYTDTLVFEPGSRYDIVFDFSDRSLRGKRVIMENIGGDAPFGGDFGDDLTPDDVFANRQTDRIMAFDVVKRRNRWIPDRFNPRAIRHYGGNHRPVSRVRKVALFEGMDEFGRLQPLLGTAEPATDYAGNPINWPDEPAYVDAGLVGPMEGSMAWHSPTTENPALGSTEVWEIYNATGDAHPVHLHLVNFEVLDRTEFTPDVIQQPVVQHNGAIGVGFRLRNAAAHGPAVDPGGEYVENAPKDMVTALPEQVTRIKMTFDKPGRYVWHCHILSHEDHEMMRVLHVGPGA